MGGRAEDPGPESEALGFQDSHCPPGFSVLFGKWKLTHIYRKDSSVRSYRGVWAAWGVSLEEGMRELHLEGSRGILEADEESSVRKREALKSTACFRDTINDSYQVPRMCRAFLVA